MYFPHDIYIEVKMVKNRIMGKKSLEMTGCDKNEVGRKMINILHNL